MTELKPCPFCGGPASLDAASNSVICGRTGCSPGWLEREQWNHRVGNAETNELIRKQKEMISLLKGSIDGLCAELKEAGESERKAAMMCDHYKGKCDSLEKENAELRNRYIWTPQGERFKVVPVSRIQDVPGKPKAPLIHCQGDYLD